MLLVPLIVQLPPPSLAREVAPAALSRRDAASVFAPLLLPVNVSVRVPAPGKASLPVLVKFNAPVPDESITPPLLVSVNNRSVFEPAPVYRSVPPLKTSEAALVAAEVLSPLPILLALPISANELTDSRPALIVVAPP